MTPFSEPPTVTITLTDAECDAVRLFFAFGAVDPGERPTRYAVDRQMDAMASVCGRISIAQYERDRTRDAAPARGPRHD